MKTTREEAKENIHENVTNKLQDLLTRTYDAEAGFKKAMENSKNSHLSSFLKRKAAQRSQFANELDQELRKLNETPTDSGSTTAALHRSWMDVKSFVSGNSDEAILEECIRGEKASLDTYKEVLEEQNFTPETTTMLSNQMNAIQGTLNTVKRLEDIADSVDA